MSARRRTAPLRVLGVMTGTSCDGLDAACIEVDANGWQPLWQTSLPYPPDLRERVFGIQQPGTKVPLKELLELNRDLGDWYGAAIQKTLSGNRDKPDLIANHGQTIAHFPSAGHKGVTLQAGDPTRIASATQITVTSNFREGDMAAGGEGAPLAPMFHQILGYAISRGNGQVAIHNLGGISNLTYIGRDGGVFAFDSGPGNSWIDAAVARATQGKKKFDKDGLLATRGTIDVKAVKEVLKHPFFRRMPPKSTGKDDFPFQYFLSKTKSRGNDLIATATAVTVESVALAYERWVIKQGIPLDSIFFCGGGAKNPAILTPLRRRFKDIRILSLDEMGFDSQFIEAQAFAMLGFLTLMGTPLGGSWTGAAGFAPPGHIIPGKNWPEVVSKIHSFR